MSRYTGPRVKIMRALGVELPGLSPKKMDKRPYPPGQHGQARKKLSEYARRLQEKQKLRHNYGVTERQLTRIVREAKAAQTATGHALISLLERRLDNVVFRAGFARSIPAARQLVNHGHVEVNGRRVDIPSFRVARGDVVGIREKSRTLVPVELGLAPPGAAELSWLAVDRAARTARLQDLPDETAIPFPIEIQLVVEYYN